MFISCYIDQLEQWFSLYKFWFMFCNSSMTITRQTSVLTLVILCCCRQNHPFGLSFVYGCVWLELFAFPGKFLALNMQIINNQYDSNIIYLPMCLYLPNQLKVCSATCVLKSFAKGCFFGSNIFLQRGLLCPRRW